MSQNQIQTHTLTLGRGRVWTISSHDFLRLYKTEILIQETKLKIDVENKGRYVPPQVCVELEHVGDRDELLSELKEVLGLRRTDEIYTSTKFSMMYLVRSFQGDLDTFISEMDQVLVAQKPDLLVVIGCKFPFDEIKGNLEGHNFNERILIQSIAESKSIWLTWNSAALNVVATTRTYTNIEVIILRKEFELCALSVVYGCDAFGDDRGVISRHNCPIRIKKTANMKMNIRGFCDDFDYGGVSGIIVNNRNKWLRGFRMEIDPCGPIQAELEALKAGLNVLEILKWPRVRIQTESLELYELMTGNPPDPAVWGAKYVGPHPYQYLVDHCKEMLNGLGCVIGLIDEEKNKVALMMTYGGIAIVKIFDEPPLHVPLLVQSNFTP